MTAYFYQPPTRQRKRTLSELEGIPERYLTVDWVELRDRVLLEANFTCQDCGNPAQTAHHWTYDHGLICHPRYLTALCWECHRAKHPSVFQDYL